MRPVWLSIWWLIGMTLVCEAGEVPPVEVKVLPPFVSQVLDLLTPVHFTGRSETGGSIALSLVKVVHCGTDTRGTMKLLGIVYPGEKPSRVDLVLREEDCRVSPSMTLKRLMAHSNTPHWVGLMELEAKWSPWQIELSAAELHGHAKSPHPKISVRVPPGLIQTYTTSFVVPVANEKKLPLHFATRESGKALIIDALVVESPPHDFSAKFTPHLKNPLPTGTNTIVAIPHALANTILDDYLAGETFMVPLVSSAPTLAVKHPVIQGNQNRYLTKAVLGLQEYPDAFNLDLEWSGHDLRLAKLTLTAREFACGTDIVCKIKKAGAEALATSIGGLLKSQYNGSFLRSLILQDVLSVRFQDREIKARAEVLWAESSETDLMLYTKVTFVP